MKIIYPERDSTENLIIASLSFSFFSFSFVFFWWYFQKNHTFFTFFIDTHKADWCSRINSTIHAFIITFGIIFSLSTTSYSAENYYPISSIHPISITFSIAIGYFLCDLLIILLWLVPLWRVFAFHHIVAVIPYIITNFFVNCISSNYVLTLYLLVEVATLPLNLRGFLESLGKQETIWHVRSIYLTFITWAITRAALPIYIIYMFWKYSFPSSSTPYKNSYSQYDDQEECMIPNLICGHIIAMFCVGVFIFIHVPEMYYRWYPKETLINKVNGDVLSWTKDTISLNKKHDNNTIYETQETTNKIPNDYSTSNITLENGEIYLNSYQNQNIHIVKGKDVDKITKK